MEEKHNPIATCNIVCLSPASHLSFIAIFPLFQIQFFLIASHWMLLYFTSCDYPKFVILVLVPQNTFMFALFTDFYIKAYIKKKPAAAAGKPQQQPLPAPSEGVLPECVDGSGKDTPANPLTIDDDNNNGTRSDSTQTSSKSPASSSVTSPKVKSN